MCIGYFGMRCQVLMQWWWNEDKTELRTVCMTEDIWVRPIPTVHSCPISVHKHRDGHWAVCSCSSIRSGTVIYRVSHVNLTSYLLLWRWSFCREHARSQRLLVFSTPYLIAVPPHSSFKDFMMISRVSESLTPNHWGATVWEEPERHVKRLPERLTGTNFGPVETSAMDHHTAARSRKSD